MPKMKLPDGWKLNERGEPYYVHMRLIAGITDNFVCNDGIRCLGIDGPHEEHVQQCPVPIALAVIRSANLDPVYEAAKGLIDPDGRVSLERVWALRDLIESLEEPE